MIQKYRILFSGLLLLLGLAASSATCSSNSPLNNPLYIDPATQDFSANPKLLDRIRAGPHGYFRFINKLFSQEVCRRLKPVFAQSPSVNLHGDAHIEQYAVTDLGRGLTDFDDSSSGPGLLDVIRFGVSLRLACRERTWEEKADELFEKFLQGYRDALNDPQLMAPEPRIVQQIRSTFSYERESYLKWVEKVMEPVPAEEHQAIWAAMKPYVEIMIAENPLLNENYFTVVKIGYLRMGIGSALDIKYLVRVQGPTSDPNDDIILEAKQVRDLSGIECVVTGQRIDPFRILIGQARIAYEPFKHLGYFYYLDHNFWVHAWVDNYEEANIGKTFESLTDLTEVVYDVGVQLGKGQVKHIGAPLDLQIRRTQLQIINTHESEIMRACQELTELTVAAWKEFCRKLK
jgi:hypothetical protein